MVPPGLLRNFPHKPGQCEINNYFKILQSVECFRMKRELAITESSFLAWVSPPLAPPVSIMILRLKSKERIGGGVVSESRRICERLGCCVRRGSVGPRRGNDEGPPAQRP